jgi:hypothetical protein
MGLGLYVESEPAGSVSAQAEADGRIGALSRRPVRYRVSGGEPPVVQAWKWAGYVGGTGLRWPAGCCPVP